MTRCWRDNNYLLCPHTAVAARYHYDTMATATLPRLCIATASPAKFEEAVREAGLNPQPTEAIRRLDGMPTRFVHMRKGEDWEKMLREKIVGVSQARAAAAAAVTS